MKNKKKIIILTAIAIVAICAIIGVLYLTTDLFKTNQQLFYKYIAKVQLMNPDYITKSIEVNNKINNNSSSSSASLNVSMLDNSQNVETTANEIKLLTATSNGLKNAALKQAYRDITLSSNDQNLLTLKYIRDDNTYGIYAENILAKYLSVENSNLKDLFAKLGVEDTKEIPDSFPTNYEEILKIDESTLGKLKETYGNLIYNNISKDNFNKVVNEDKTETISLSLTQREFVNIFKAILETAKNDNTLLDLIVSKGKMLNYSDINSESIETEIQKIIDDISNENELSDEEFLKISLVKKGKATTKVIIETYRAETIDYTTIDQEFQSNPMAQTVKQTIEIDFPEINKIALSIKENDNEVYNIIMNYYYDDNNINYNIELQSKENVNTVKISYQISNYKTDNIAQNLSAIINQGTEGSYKISLANNIVFKQDVQISKLTTENSAKINDMTSEEISQLFTALGNRIGEIYGKKLINPLQ